MAARISDLVPAVVADPDAISAEQVSDVRLGALALAATIGQLTDDGRLPRWYVDVTASITALERQRRRRRPARTKRSSSFRPDHRADWGLGA